MAIKTKSSLITPKHPISKGLSLIDSSTHIEFFMQCKYISAHYLPLDGSIVLPLSSNSIIVAMIEKEKYEEKGNGVYMWASRKKNSEFGENQQLALINENMKVCLKMGRNYLFYRSTNYED